MWMGDRFYGSNRRGRVQVCQLCYIQGQSASFIFIFNRYSSTRNLSCRPEPTLTISMTVRRRCLALLCCSGRLLDLWIPYFICSIRSENFSLTILLVIFYLSKYTGEFSMSSSAIELIILRTVECNSLSTIAAIINAILFATADKTGTWHVAAQLVLVKL